jgi:tripartite-type tricarboxylate transporter receptor subunit TctC
VPKMTRDRERNDLISSQHNGRKLAAISRMRIWMVVLVALLATAMAAPSFGQLNRDQSITIVIPYSAGAGADITTRLLAQKVTDNGGPRFVIDYRPGGGGTIGAVTIKRSAPDGSKLFLADTGTFAVNPSLIPDLPYDPIADFAPITPFRTHPLVLAVPMNVAANSVAELVQLANKTPGGLSYASQGWGSGGHVASELLAKASKAPLVHIPYRGSRPALLDLVAGRVAMMSGSYDGVSEFARNKQVKVLAVFAKTRLGVLPEVPTMAEAGYSDIEFDNWFGLVAPAQTPQTIIQVLNEVFVRAARSPDFVERLRTEGISALTSTPEEFSARIKSDITRLAPIVKEIRLQSK